MGTLESIFVHQIERGDIVLAVVFVLLTSYLVYQALRLMRVEAFGGRFRPVSRLAWEMCLLLGLEQGYEFTRGHISDHPEVALPNAYRLLDLEWRHGFFVEYRLEQFFLHFRTLMNAIDAFYVVAHVAVTIGVLMYLYAYRRQYFWFTRNLLIVTTAIALAAFYLYPTAPPRFFANYGFVDPAVLHHFVSAGGSQPGSFTYNPYAAMPSLHVGYALVVSWGVVLAAQSRLVRLLAVLYPLAMSAAVVISGEHWFLDVVGALVTVFVAAA
ncbi:MAG: hypothetical protein DLM70_08105, partial [Chloroflexi bacterium]